MSEQLKISGQKRELTSTQGQWSFARRPGGWCIATRKKSDGTLERKRFAFEVLGEHFGLNVQGQTVFGELSEASYGSGDEKAGDADLAAQFPGKIRAILVQEGQQVKEGDRLLLVEAMKMELAIKAPFAGSVSKILVEEGQQVGPGDRFVELQAQEGD